MTLTLADRTGQVLARVWEGALELAEQFDAGEVVKVAGDVENYRDRTQFIVVKLRRAEDDEFDLRDMQRTTLQEIEALHSQLQAYIEAVENPHLNTLLRHFFDDTEFLSAFSAAPAARQVHHAYVGGLLEHTLHVAALAERLIELYPNLDSDPLLTGVLLHDSGKIRGFNWRMDIDYTDEGRLLGHVVIGIEMIAPVIDSILEFPSELALLVKHMVVSHHGRYEWGAPRRPKTVEAMALHHLEDLDAQVNRFDEILHARREPGQAWTDYDRLLRRSLYAGSGDQNPTEDDTLSVEEASQLS